MPKVRISVRIDLALRERINKLAADSHRNFSQQVEHLLFEATKQKKP